MGQKQDKIIQYIMRLMYMAGTSWGLMLNDFIHTHQGYFFWPCLWNMVRGITWTHNMTTTKLYIYFIIMMSQIFQGISGNLQLS